MEDGAVVPDEFEGDLRVGKRHLFHDAFHGVSLGNVFFEEFQTGGDVIENVPCHQCRPLRAAGFCYRLHLGGGDLHQSAGFRLPCLGEHFHPGNGGDGSKGLATEAQSADAV